MDYEIWNWCERRNIWLYATHLPGVENEIVESLSRRFSASVEWELSQTLFDEITSRFGKPTIDLFASHHNAKVHKYCSWFADKYCWKTDAFSFRWNDEFFYIFPLFRLVGRCWRKIMVDKSDAVLLAPEWPNQHLYALLRRTNGNLSSPSICRSNIDFNSVPLTAYRY